MLATSTVMVVAPETLPPVVKLLARPLSKRKPAAILHISAERIVELPAVSQPFLAIE